jgi:hypothetical protein
MKKWLVFVLGVVTGFVLTIGITFILYVSQNPESNTTETAGAQVKEESEKDNGTTWFNEPGDIIDESSVKVIQVIAEDAALVCGKSKRADLYTGPVYLLTNGDGKYYYDDQIVKVPQGKVVRQMGIYRYPAKNEILKTVPIIEIVDK